MEDNAYDTIRNLENELKKCRERQQKFFHKDSDKLCVESILQQMLDMEKKYQKLLKKTMKLEIQQVSL